jgi:hypothetical protein
VPDDATDSTPRATDAPNSSPLHRLLSRLTIVIGASALILLAVNLGLHFGQKRHDRLNFDPEAAFKPGQPFVPGEIFATTMAAIMDHELNDGFGWRPNDFVLWGPEMMADNNSNRQLGILMALRETSRVFKDHMTKISSNEYDPNLVIADNDFRNDPYRWALPSAESKYRDAVAHLHAYVKGLHSSPQTSSELNQRNVELERLLQAWSDLLGDAHASLYRTRSESGGPIYPWIDDDYFYHAQGYAHVIYYMMKAVKLEYHQSLTTKPVLATLLDEAMEPLGKAAVMKPFVVLDGAPDGLLANHRRNLDAYISEARQKIYSMREELER